VLPEFFLLRLLFLHILQCCHRPREKEGMPTNPELECHISVTANRTCCTQLVHMANWKIYRTHVNRSDDKIVQDTVHCLKYIQYTIHGMPICHKPHNFSNWDPHITRQLGYKYCLSKCCPQKYCFSLYILTNITGWSVGLLRITHVFPVSREVCISGLWQTAITLFKQLAYFQWLGYQYNNRYFNTSNFKTKENGWHETQDIVIL